MIQIKNLQDNSNIVEVASMGCFKVLEYQKDLSVNAESAIAAYYASEMNIRKRQVYIQLQNQAVTVSAGAMQWSAGDVKMGADVKGVGDFIGKAIKGSVTKESAAKPRYSGTGYVMLDPTYKHILLERVEDWGKIVLEDGLFLACDSDIKQKVVSRGNFSSAMMGGEGLFNLALEGHGVAVLESPVPREELIVVELQDDEIRIDGNFAIAWSGSLEFRVEKSTKSLMGSAVSGEGFVNVYRGTGKVLLAPIA